MQVFVVQLYMSALAQNKCQSYIDKSQQTQPPRQEVGSSAHPYLHRTFRSPDAREGEAPRVYL